MKTKVKINGVLAWTLMAILTVAALTMPLSAIPITARMSGAIASNTVVIEDGPVPLAGGTKVLKPQASGTVTYSGSGATVDASNSSEGYVMIKYSGGRSRVKAQITKSGSATYTYNISTSGSYDVLPLTGGNGTYSIVVFENVSGNQYAQAVSCSVNVNLRSNALPYLYPNQYVNFSSGSKAVKTGESLASGAKNDLAIVEKVYNYVLGNISYDNQTASAIASGQITTYIPNVDNVLATGKGICFDYAAVMTAMLRSQQIPTRMEHGYVSNGAYHAWLSTYIVDVGWVNGVIHFDGKNWRLMDPTFAAGGASAEYIGSGSNYRTQYVY